MTGLTNKTLAQIVTENHRAAAVFEKYHLDFCCKGKRSLQQACAEQRINADELIHELGAVNTEAGNHKDAFPFGNLSLSQLSDYIVNTHHAFINKEAPQILSWLVKVTSKHGGRHPELLKITELFASVKEEMELHMQKEELILFPRIKEMERIAKEEERMLKINITYLQSPISLMEQEHDHAGRLMEEIRLLSNDYQAPGDACTTYLLSFASLKAFEFDLHRHVHLENNILFPKAIALFRTVKEASFN